MKLNNNEIRNITNLLEKGKPLPEKYRFLLFDTDQEVELLWNGKNDEVENTVLPFQAIEHIDEPRSEEKECFAQDIAERLEDDHSLGFFRKVVDLMSENLIYQALSEVKDTYLTGKIKKSKAALFTSVIKSKALEHNINLGIK